MNKTLATFMSVVAMVMIMSSLYYGITYQSLKQKHEADVEVIDQFQIKGK